MEEEHGQCVQSETKGKPIIYMKRVTNVILIRSVYVRLRMEVDAGRNKHGETLNAWNPLFNGFFRRGK